jgi:hypothetical protein
MDRCECGIRQCGSMLISSQCNRHGKPEGERARVGFAFPPTKEGRRQWEEQRGELEAKARAAKEKGMR